MLTDFPNWSMSKVKKSWKGLLLSTPKIGVQGVRHLVSRILGTWLGGRNGSSLSCKIISFSCPPIKLIAYVKGKIKVMININLMILIGSPPPPHTPPVPTTPAGNLGKN